MPAYAAPVSEQFFGFILGGAFVLVVVVVIVEEIYYRLTGRRFLPHGPGPGDFKSGSCPECGHLRAESNLRIPVDAIRPRSTRPAQCKAEIESSGWGGDYCSCTNAYHGS